MKQKVYIAGKITGFPGFKAKFSYAENILLRRGYVVLNPAILPPGLSQEEYLHICFAMIDTCDIVYFLDNWEDSEGAKKEWAYSSEKEKQLLYEAQR